MNQTLDRSLSFEVLPMRINYEQAELGLAPHRQAHAGCSKDLHKIGFAHAGGGEDAHVVIHGFAVQGNGDLFHQPGSISEVAHLDITHNLAQETELIPLCSFNR
ncbi:MAG: hypothetical protein BWY13_00128 [Euryarchaeota archaeon ADurb.Bin190]|nr:MAG: hypothetical protein BWY13_00128 [Euryarchaeota archaeon ADurb.Bin190]